MPTDSAQIKRVVREKASKRLRFEGISLKVAPIQLPLVGDLGSSL
jgi:hypothetical protein